MKYLITFLALGAAGSPLTAQTRVADATYLPQRDTIFVESGNPHRMYWVIGGDTVGNRLRPRTIERQIWRADKGGIAVSVWITNLAADRTEEHHLLSFTGRGHLVKLDSAPPGLSGERDALLPLPAGPLTADRTWVDTLEGRGPKPGGDGVLTLIRTYRVESIQDSAGTRIATISATGQVHYRDAWWRDSTAGVYSWIDVRGPISEQARFDIRRGQLLERSWDMDLRGTGGQPDSTGKVDTVPAGLLSSSQYRIVSVDQARLVGRPLPGVDTSYTIDGGLVLGHTVLLTPDSIASSLSRNDGLVGTVTTWFQGGRPTRQRAEWTDSTGETVRSEIRVDGSLLRIRRDGALDTTVTIPSGVWGIADYAMQEHLAPILLRIPSDGGLVPLAIYRPVGEHWDVGRAGRRTVVGGSIVTIQIGDSGRKQYLLYDDKGDLLYGENSDPVGHQRIPRPGTARYALVQRLLGKNGQ